MASTVSRGSRIAPETQTRIDVIRADRALGDSASFW
jgi:hypothetical protein